MVILCTNTKNGSGRCETLPGLGCSLFAHVERHRDNGLSAAPVVDFDRAGIFGDEAEVGSAA
ncbi:hypothetical protein ACFXPY_32065 [Streptomyces sp. NPDC059153]|uniref:hypothetical protein n=1 Tax=Streptomyces sp. NPDC059153 TaxID=3346743 RepID=UPI0036C5E0BE